MSISQRSALSALLLVAAPARATPAQVTLAEAELLDQDGQPVRFPSQVVADQIVVMTFVYTTCTSVCPVLSAIFTKLRDQAGGRLGKQLKLVSLTVDPARDTPARLRAQAEKLGAPAGWTWLTGSKENVDRVLKGLGAYAPDYTNHAPMVLVGDGLRGTWTRLNGFPSPDQILAKVDELLEARKQSPAGAPDPEAKARAYFTDTPLLTHRDEPVRFYSDVLQNRVVVISFIYTRCRDACPLQVQKLNAVRGQLGALFGREVSFVSISVDPVFDTPPQLLAFARRHGAAHPGWTFLTGRKADVELVVKKLGQYVADVEGHSTWFIAGNEKKRHWTKIRPDTSPAAVAEMVRDLAQP